MRQELVTIDLGDGEWAKVYKDVLRVTARLHNAELQKHMTPVGQSAKGVLISEANDAKAIKPDYRLDYAAVDHEAINEIYILNQTAEWSLGEVSRQTLDRVMTQEQFSTMTQALNKLYEPDPLGASVTQDES